jgi:hypothetical protein
MGKTPLVLLGLAGVAISCAVALWCAFIRPAPEIFDSGVITSKVYAPARSVELDLVGPRRESYNRQKLEIPDGYLFGIRIRGLGTAAQFWMIALPAAGFEVGEEVRVRYAKRGIPLISKRVQVLEMSHAALSSGP